MKKLTLLTIFAILMAFYSCNQEDIFDKTSSFEKLNFELEGEVKLDRTTQNVSMEFLNMGVTQVYVENNPNFKKYSVSTEKSFSLNGESLDLSTVNVILKDDMLFLENKPSLKLSIYENKPYIVSDSYFGFPEENYYFEKEFNILLFFMEEIILDDSLKIDTQVYLENSELRGGCSFWNTYYVYATGGSRSVALANLESAVKKEMGMGDVSGCSKLGDPDASCYLDNHGCVATQAFCCE